MIRSLELGWIARQDKGLVLPELVFSSNFEHGGLYLDPWPGEQIIDERGVDGTHGIIIISELYEEQVEQNIAHEWRHHWQYFRGLMPMEVAEVGDMSEEHYDQSIIAYFMEHPSEADALRFQTKMVDCPEHWKDLLIPKGFIF